MRTLLKAVLIASVFTTVLTGCQSAYYAAWEKVGVEKRDILVDRVENAKDSQEDAQEEFSSALEQFSALINFDGGELEDIYDDLNAQYEASQSAADKVSDRINSVESVAEALFDEWQQELEQYTNATYRRNSEQQLRQTKLRYGKLIRAMRNAEKTMQPVLSALQDNVLFLKHNLNASAIGALQGELGQIEKEVAVLIKEMKESIAVSDAFIAEMNNGN